MPALFVAAIVFTGLAAAAAPFWTVARRKANRPLGEEPPAVNAYAPGADRAKREAWEKVKRNRDDMNTVRRYLLAVVAFLAVGAAIMTLFASLTTVGTKQVGIVTEFGRPTGTVLTNGLHLKAPWQKVTEFDAAIQTDSYGDTTGGNTETPCIQVRIVNQATACVSLSVRWRIAPDAADDLFRDYRTFDNVRASLVTRDLRATLNDVLGNYDALSTVATVEATGTERPPSAPTYDEISTQVTAELTNRVGGQIEIQSVVVSFVGFDETTQGRINALQGEVAGTRVATQRQATAAADAEANRILAESVSRDPNVLVSQCMNTLRTLAEKGQPLPAGFSCWPGQNAPFAVTGP